MCLREKHAFVVEGVVISEVPARAPVSGYNIYWESVLDTGGIPSMVHSCYDGCTVVTLPEPLKGMKINRVASEIEKGDQAFV